MKNTNRKTMFNLLIWVVIALSIGSVLFYSTGISYLNTSSNSTIYFYKPEKSFVTVPYQEMCETLYQNKEDSDACINRMYYLNKTPSTRHYAELIMNKYKTYEIVGDNKDSLLDYIKGNN